MKTRTLIALPIAAALAGIAPVALAQYDRDYRDYRRAEHEYREHRAIEREIARERSHEYWRHHRVYERAYVPAPVVYAPPPAPAYSSVNIVVPLSLPSGW